MPAEPRPRPGLTGPHFDALLKRLGEESDVAARDYATVRRKLVGFFERRGIRWADELADETIDRVARRLSEGETVLQMSAYFYGVARLVLLEWRRREDREEQTQREQLALLTPEQEDARTGLREARLACLEKCLRDLPRDSRDLIVKYHKARLEARQLLADALGITYASLKTRAHRVRRQLESCLVKCLEPQVGNQ